MLLLLPFLEAHYGDIASTLAFILSGFGGWLTYRGGKQHEHQMEDLRRAHERDMVRFSQLQERRAVVLAEVYSNLVAVVRDCEASLMVLAPPGELDEASKRAKASLTVFSDHYHRHRIYFPEDVVVLIDATNKDLNALVSTLPGRTLQDTFLGVLASGEGYETFRNTNAGKAVDLSKRVLPVEEKIRATFQELLGGR